MTFLLAHLSDPHIGPLPRIPLKNLINKRLTGVLNWHGARASIHNMEVLAGLIADIRAQSPDHIALTGDLVNVGYAPEFPLAAKLVAPLGNADFVSIIPGNHDAYVPGSLGHMAEAFRPFMLGDGAVSVPGLPPFPYLRVRGNIALIGVNSGVPTLPFVASGKVGAEQRSRLGAMLDEARQRGLFRVVMIHHPPYRRGVKFGRGLFDARAFEALIARHGAELILHGHNHRYQLGHLAGPLGEVPVLGVGSASAVPGTPHHCAEYNLIRIETDRISITRRGIVPNDFEVRCLGQENVDLT